MFAIFLIFYRSVCAIPQGCVPSKCSYRVTFIIIISCRKGKVTVYQTSQRCAILQPRLKFAPNNKLMLPASRGIRKLGRLSGDVASSETLPLEESDAKGWYIIMPKVGQGGGRAEERMETRT